jgi:UPF0288 family protein (methanogenesis marker protein 3)
MKVTAFANCDLTSDRQFFVYLRANLSQVKLPKSGKHRQACMDQVKMTMEYFASRYLTSKKKYSSKKLEKELISDIKDALVFAKHKMKAKA